MKYKNIEIYYSLYHMDVEITILYLGKLFIFESELHRRTTYPQV